MDKIDRTTPTISVCIPTFNHAHFLKDAVESVLAQTFADFELVIVDNCSTDSTRELVSKYVEADSRVTYICNDINVGPQENLNRCLRYSTGKYVKILCADDLLEPTCLEESLRVLEEGENVVLAASARQIVDEQLHLIRVAGYSVKNVHVAGRDMIGYSLFNGNYIGEPSAVIFRRDGAERGFDTSYRLLIDLEMWLHLLEKGNMAYIGTPLCRFRFYGAQETNKVISSLDFIDEEVRLYKKYIGMEYVDATLLNRLKRKFKLAWMLPLHDAGKVDAGKLLKKVRSHEGYGLLYLVFLGRLAAGRLAGILKPTDAAQPNLL
jgi:glycosyltransferase involved in cell wall biosynthesis